MYRVILVDDEPLIKDGLRETIEWDTYGLEIAGEAANGIEALELIRTINPHILITDIKMPEMNGIELIKKIHENNIDIKIIILSGYSDYKYLKEAVKYGVESYLLKPIDDQELKSILVSTIRNIDEEMFLNIQQREGLQLLKNNTLRRLINNTIGSQEYKEKAEFLGLEISGDEFQVCVIMFDSRDKTAIFKEDDQLNSFAVLNVCEEIILNRRNGIAFSDTPGLVILLLNNHNQALQNETTKIFLKEIQQLVKMHLRISIKIGVGQGTTGIELLYRSFDEAMYSVKFAKTMNSDLVFYNNITLEHLNSTLGIRFDFQQIEMNIFESRSKEIAVTIYELFSCIKENNIISIEAVQILCKCFIFSIINKLSNRTGKDIYWIIEKLNFDYRLLESFQKINEYENWLKSICFSASELIVTRVQKNTNMLVNETMKFINENYYHDISLKKISEKFFVNSAYLGQIFAKETGKSFTDYINKIRIEKAKELLSNSNMKVYEIAEKVGFTDSHYFLKIFKKYTGVNPSDIRKIKS